MQALSEKVRELEARLCETTEFDTLRARVRVLENWYGELWWRIGRRGKGSWG